MDAMDRMPGDAEAAGAAAGMQDVYGRELPSIGDRISWRLGESGWDVGRIVEIESYSPPRAIAQSEHDGRLIEIDPRPIRDGGNTLPF